MTAPLPAVVTTPALFTVVMPGGSVDHTSVGVAIGAPY